MSRFAFRGQGADAKGRPIMLMHIARLTPRSARTGAAHGRGKAAIYASLFGVLLAFAFAPTETHAQINFARLRTWGLETYNETDRTLRVSGTRFFAESNSINGTQYGGFNDRAYVWPISMQFRVFNTLTQIEPATYTPILQQFADQIQGAYWDNGYRSGAAAGIGFMTTTAISWWR